PSFPAPHKAPSAMVSTDRDALEVLLHSTGGAGWKRNDNWGTDADLSLWHGVEVDDQGCVVKLILENNNLKGTPRP
ncbi:unnamed protein product, partial [Scytosiphon promiscuus]